MQRDWQTVATSQAGAISLAQLKGSEGTRRQLNRLVADGFIRRAGRGVFVSSFGSQNDTWEQELWVRLLAAGPDSVVFRSSAALLWRFDGFKEPVTEVGLPGGRQSRIPGVHRSSMRPGEVTTHLGFRVTTPGRTLADIGAVVPDTVVERALESALRLKLLALRDLEASVVESQAKGASALRRVLSRRPAQAAPTESDAETIFAQIARECGLPDPRRQYTIILAGKRFRIDFAWPEFRIAVEIDGASTHSLPGALRADLHRQNSIILDGWLVLRYTWDDLVQRPSGAVIPALISAWTQRGGVIPRRAETPRLRHMPLR